MNDVARPKWYRATFVVHPPLAIEIYYDYRKVKLKRQIDFPTNKLAKVLCALANKYEHLIRRTHPFPQLGLNVRFVMSVSGHPPKIVGISKVELHAVVDLPPSHEGIRVPIFVAVENYVGRANIHEVSVSEQRNSTLTES